MMHEQRQDVRPPMEQAGRSARQIQNPNPESRVQGRPPGAPLDFEAHEPCNGRSKYQTESKVLQEGDLGLWILDLDSGFEQPLRDL